MCKSHLYFSEISVNLTKANAVFKKEKLPEIFRDFTGPRKTYMANNFFFSRASLPAEKDSLTFSHNSGFKPPCLPFGKRRNGRFGFHHYVREGYLPTSPLRMCAKGKNKIPEIFRDFKLDIFLVSPFRLFSGRDRKTQSRNFPRNAFVLSF